MTLDDLFLFLQALNAGFSLLLLQRRQPLYALANFWCWVAVALLPPPWYSAFAAWLGLLVVVISTRKYHAWQIQVLDARIAALKRLHADLESQKHDQDSAAP